MALVFGGSSRCPICSELIDTDTDVEIVATTAFSPDGNDALLRFADAAMHRTCFTKWNHRDEFIAAHNNYYATHYRGMRFMHENGTVEERPPKQ